MKPRWKCFCGCELFVFSETADVESSGCIDENGEFSVDDVIGYDVTRRSDHAYCVECNRAYPFAGTLGGEQ